MEESKMETQEAEIAVQAESSPTDQPFTNAPNLPTEIASPRYAPLSKVYARDNDGLLYIAVVRRQIYGPNYNPQVLLGMKSVAEADAAAAPLTTPQWHYFVHFNQWGVNFDRWIQEDLIFPLEDDKVQDYAERLRKEHRTLQLEMQQALPRKKGKIKIDGLAFLKAWRIRWDRINDELGFVETSSATEDPCSIETTTPKARLTSQPTSQPALTWNKRALAKEAQMQSMGLTSQGRSPSNGIAIPSAFRKDLVEQWEMICQCGMLPILPSKVSVRQALDHYVESKTSGGNMTVLKQNVMNGTDGSSQATDSEIQVNSTPNRPTDDKIPDEVSDQATAQIAPSQCAQELPPLDDNSKDIRNAAADEQAQQWQTMANGIARFFDEALPSRLLYKEEQPLLGSFEDEFATRQFSETFGCGHLLRLLVQLPDILEEQLDDNQRKPIVAKINDFVRYLHKNHGKLLTQRYHRPSAKQSAGVPNNQRKKKVRLSSAREDTASTTEKEVDAMVVEEQSGDSGPKEGQSGALGEMVVEEQVGDN